MSHLRSQLGLAAIVLTSAASVFVYRTVTAADSQPTRDLAVNCGPAHRAVVRQLPNQSWVSVDCVPAGPSAANLDIASTPADLATLAAIQPGAARMIPMVYAPEPQTIRAVAPADARVTRATTSANRSAPRRIEKKTSWQKRALVIGGSAGAGAGIGALIGGKKGALIGAAVGGGGATVVDLVRTGRNP